MKKYIITLLSIATLLLLSACYKNNLADLTGNTTCDTSNMTYSADIEPILKNNCTNSGCHESTAALTFPLTSYEDVKMVALDGRLLRSLRHQVGVAAMPKGMSQLDSCTISKIEAWINQGTLNN